VADLENRLASEIYFRKMKIVKCAFQIKFQSDLLKEIALHYVMSQEEIKKMKAQNKAVKLSFEQLK